MAKRRKFSLGNRRKLVTIWSILGFLAIISLIKKITADQADPIQVVNSFAKDIALVAIILFICWLSYQAVKFFIDKKIFSDITPREKSDFCLNPSRYDKKIVNVYGRIEKVLSDDLGEKLKRHLTDAYRNIVGSDDHKNRYIHQRFIVRSPQLKDGERVIVYNNIKYEKLPLRKGSWVVVRGEYVHRPGRKRTLWGWKDNFYGLIHHTHEPKGGARVFKNKTEMLLFLKNK